MSRNSIVSEIADRYEHQCKECASNASLPRLCSDYDHKELGYSTFDSMKSAVSKELGGRGFNKKSFTMALIKESHEKILENFSGSKNDLIELIRDDLAQHKFKHNFVRDSLQAMMLVSEDANNDPALNEFILLVSKGHSFWFSVEKSGLTRHGVKKAKAWFVGIHGGDERETKKARRKERIHAYKNVKDFLILENDDQQIRGLWTAIGFTFADGSVQQRNVQIVITESDDYYLRDYCIPQFVDNSIPGNSGPDLIYAQSNEHDTSYENSKIVARAHLEDSSLAGFLAGLGLPRNKTSEGIQLSHQVLDLSDKYFFCFLAGLFAGDGCITAGKREHLHLSFDLNCRQFCEVLAEQIELRLKVPMSVSSHKTKSGKTHFKLTATTNWRALSLLLVMLFYAPFHLKRKSEMAKVRVDQLVASVPAYYFFKRPLSDFEKGRCSERTLNFYLEKLKERAR